MRFGVTLPNLGVGDDPEVIVDLAREAEDAGWDGVFIWDTPGGAEQSSGDELYAVHEAWLLLALMATRTERVRLGTMITPLAWRHPWMVARQALTMDRLSKGRFVLCVGLGAPPEEGPTPFHEETDRRTRARMLDEGLEILAGLWSGEPFSFDGEHYTIEKAVFRPQPIEKIPVWVVGAWQRVSGAWPKMRSLRRALRWDGVLPHVFEGPKIGTGDFRPDDIRAMSRWIRTERTEPFDIVVECGSSDTNTPAGTVRALAEAGATWWLEPVWWSMYSHLGDPGPLRERIRQGPPKI